MNIGAQYLIYGIFSLVGILLFPSGVVSLDSKTAAVFCQNPKDCFSQFVMELGKLSSGSSPTPKAEELFQELTSVHDSTDWSDRARLRYGHALRTLHPVKAIPLLQSSMSAFPTLNDYLQYWLFQAYVNAELWTDAGNVAREFVQEHKESPFRVPVLYEAGPVFTRIGDCHTARSVLSQALMVDSHHPKSASALFQIGTCTRQLGEDEKIGEIFRELWWRFPLSPRSLDAEEWLTSQSDVDFVPTSEERYQRGMSFYHRGMLKRAVKEFQQVEALSKNSETYFQAQFSLAKSKVRLKQYDEAEKVLKGLIESPSSRQDDAWVWLGRAYLRGDKGKALGILVETLPRNRLSKEQQAKLYIFYGIWLEDHDRWPEAVQVYEKARQIAKTSSTKMKALWKMGWVQYQHGEFAKANIIFQKIVKKTKNPRSASLRHARSRALYWLARSQEQIGELGLAGRHLAQIYQAYPLTYYGQLAKTRLGWKVGNPQAWAMMASTETLGQGIPTRLQQDRHFQKIQALQALQLFKEAVKEIHLLYSAHGSDPKVFQPLMSLANELGAYDIGIRLAIRHYGKKVRTGKLAPTSWAWSGAFPLGYQGIIQSVVPSHVDPFLVSGLIREESLYRAGVISAVGAVGLMQLMPSTAKHVALQLNLSESEDLNDRLFQPEYNIRVGTHYLGQLLKEFEGNIIYSVAAYNAGPQAVERWMGKHGHRPSDEFVELIGYRETRGYVKRVVGSYRIYRSLYGQSCPPISLDRFC